MKKVLSIFIAVMMVISAIPLSVLTVLAASTEIWNGNVATDFNSGTGTEDDPYIIKNANELAFLANSCDWETDYYEDKYIRLDEDIILNDTTDWESWGGRDSFSNIIAPVNSWDPIENFKGNFNGNEHTVSGIYMDSYDGYGGLFEVIDENAVVKNVGIIKSFIKGTGEVGAVAGENRGLITNCYNTSRISGNYTGGIVGWNYNNAVISNCYNTGVIHGEYDGGGIAGWNDIGSVIKDCYNSGAVGSYEESGGITANNSRKSEIINCYNVGSVIGNNGIGGITANNSSECVITNCYYLDDSAISATNTYGTVLTKAKMKVKSNYKGFNFDSVWELGFDTDYDYPTLMFFGSKNFRWHVEVINEGKSVLNNTYSHNYSLAFPSVTKTGYKIAYFIDQDGMKYSPNDNVSIVKDTVFTAVWYKDNTQAGVWDGSIATGFASGSGEYDDPYIITNGAQLAYLAKKVNEGYSYSDIFFELANNIKLNDNSIKFSTILAGENDWTPIGDKKNVFKGNFDGNGYTISGMYVNSRNDYQGLFGYTGYDSTVKNVGIVDSFVAGFENIGGIAGYAYQSDITDCFNKGKVVGSKNVGGIAGNTNHGTGDMVNCYNSGSIEYTGEQAEAENIGGVVGNCYSNLIDCYNTGTVKGGKNVGGIVGYSGHSSVKNSYNKGSVTGLEMVGGIAGDNGSRIEGCYNISDIAGDTNVGGIAGFSDAEIKESYNNGNISSVTEAGGIAGTNNMADIVKCYNSGIVTGETLAGGIVAENDMGDIENCYNIGEIKGTVSGEGKFGGIAGKNSSGDVKTSYNKGSVYYGEFRGGIVGSADEIDDIENCYYLTTCVTNPTNRRGTPLSDFNMKKEDSFEGFNFNGYWEIGYRSDYGYPTLRCFGSKQYNWLVTIISEGKAVKSKLYPNDYNYTFAAPCEKAGHSVSYFVESENDWWCYELGQSYTVTEDISFITVWHKDNVEADTWDGTVATGFASGEGTEDDPYIIENAAQLAYLAETSVEWENDNYEGKFFRLDSNIKLNDDGIKYTNLLIGENVWKPFNFKGTFDGNGHTISGICVPRTATDNGGLFDELLTGATVKNLGVKNSYTFENSFSGSIVKYNYGTLSNCYISGTVTDGVVGCNYEGGVIDNCYNTANVTDGNGIADENYGTVSNCYNEGKVKYVGIVGSNYGIVDNCYNSGEASCGITSSNSTSGVITNCYNTATITGESYISGLVNGNEGIISNCYNMGDVIGENYIAGIAFDNSGSISNCYNTGNISGGGYIGGITFNNYGAINACYNVGKINCEHFIGSVIFDNYGTLDDCYYLNTTVTDFDQVYGTALTLEQMKNQISYVGFDFDEVWTINNNSLYPYPTLTGNVHIFTHTVTFVDSDGETVIATQQVASGKNAIAPDMTEKTKSDADYIYTFKEWDKELTNITADTTIKAVYNKTAIIKFTGKSFNLGDVKNGYTKDSLAVDLESFYNEIICNTTNGFTMVCEVEWDLSAYNPDAEGIQTIVGKLKITDSPFYALNGGEKITATVNVLPDGQGVNKGTDQDFKYSVNGDGNSVTVTDYEGAVLDVVIPETLDGKTVTAIGNEAFKNQTMRSVFVPACVETIGDNAFEGCSNLVSVVLSDGLQSVGQNAFTDTSLTNVTLPNTVTNIGANAFGYDANNAKISGFKMYGYVGAAFNYASTNEFEFVTLEIQSNDEIGISARVEDGYTLSASEVTSGWYYETAAQVVETAENVSVFNIKINSETHDDVQPNNVMAITIKLPQGMNPEKCKIYRINSDGTLKNMNAKIVGDSAIFYVSHLSYYAMMELDHLPAAPIITPATTTADGSVLVRCAECGEIISDDIIKKVSTVELSDSEVIYNTEERIPEVIVKDSDGVALIKGTDYTVDMPVMKDVGTYTVTVNFMGKYSGTKKLFYKIDPMTSDITAKLSYKTTTYTGKTKTPSVTVTCSDGTKLGTDSYTVKYATGRKNVGTYKVTVTLKGNYAGTKELSFKINPMTSGITAKLSYTTATYNGKTKKPTVTVKRSDGTKLTTASYSVKYATGRKKVGKYKITVTLKGNYKGTKTLYLTINPVKTTVTKITAAKKALKVYISKKSTQVSGYQIQYSTSKTFKSYKTKTISSYKTTSTTISKLTAKKKYYVRVRTYKTVSGVKYYSAWSAYKTGKTK